MKTVEVVYIGPATEVKVKEANLIASRGQPFKVSAAAAESLLKKPDLWREMYPAPGKPAAAKKTVRKAAKKKA